jgi:hypothetical protein
MPLPRRSTVGLLLGLGVGWGMGFAMTVVALVPAHADGLWIAVAASQSSGESATQTGDTAMAAFVAATQGCNRSGHVYDCQLIAYGQGGCVATATPGLPNSIRGAWAATREEAVAAALAKAVPGSRAVADCMGDPGLRGRS